MREEATAAEQPTRLRVPPPPKDEFEPIDRYSPLFPGGEPEPAPEPPASPPGTPIRLPHISRRGMLVGLLVVGALAAVLWMRDGGGGGNNASRPLPEDVTLETGPSTSTTARPAPPPLQWTVFADPDGRFTVELPAPPVRESDSLPSAVGNLDLDSFASDTADITVTVAVVKLDPNSFPDLPSVAAAMATSSGLQVSSEAPSVDPSGRAQVDARMSNITGTVFMGRFIDAGGGRMYALVVGSSTGAPDDAFNRVVTSFKIA